MFETYVDAFIVGQKYCVWTFTGIAQRHVSAVLKEMSTYGNHGELYMHLVRYAYCTHEEDATELRWLLVEHFVDHFKSLRDSVECEWRSLLEIAGFAFEVTDSLLMAKERLEWDLNDERSKKRRKPNA